MRRRREEENRPCTKNLSCCQRLALRRPCLPTIRPPATSCWSPSRPEWSARRPPLTSRDPVSLVSQVHWQSLVLMLRHIAALADMRERAVVAFPRVASATDAGTTPAEPPRTGGALARGLFACTGETEDVRSRPRGPRWNSTGCRQHLCKTSWAVWNRIAVAAAASTIFFWAGGRMVVQRQVPRNVCHVMLRYERLGRLEPCQRLGLKRCGLVHCVT